MKLPKFLRRKKPERPSAVGLAFVLNGKPILVHAEHWQLNRPKEYELEPLADALTRWLAVGGEDLMPLGDALIQAGWQPPLEPTILQAVERKP